MLIKKSVYTIFIFPHGNYVSQIRRTGFLQRNLITICIGECRVIWDTPIIYL